MTDDEILTAVREHIVTLMRRCTTSAQRAEVAEVTLHIGYELTRGIHGNQFVTGWLDAAHKDLQSNPPKVVMVRQRLN